MNVIFATGMPEINQHIIDRYPNMQTQAEVNELGDLPDRISSETQAVIISGYLDRTEQLVEVLLALRHRNGDCRVILIMPETDEEFRQGLASIGIYDLIEPDGNGEIDEGNLFRTIDKPATAAQLLAPRESDAGEEPRERVIDKLTKGFLFKPKSRRIKVVGKQIIAFWSPMPRGKTTLAAHAAVHLAENTQLRIILADADPFKPDLHRYFGATREKGFADALALVQEGRADYEHLDSCLVPHPKHDRLDMLYGHRHTQDYYQVQPGSYGQLLERLLIRRDAMIVDTHGVYDFAATDAVLRIANTVYVPIHADRHDVERVNLYVREFRRHGDFDVRKFRLLVNEYGAMDMTFAEVEAQSELPVAEYIPYVSGLQRQCKIDRKVMKAIGSLDVLERR